MGCSTWPEITREALEPKPLSEVDKKELSMIVEYSGPRDMQALLDNSVLRFHGISSMLAGHSGEARAFNITFGGIVGEWRLPSHHSIRSLRRVPKERRTDSTNASERRWPQKKKKRPRSYKIGERKPSLVVGRLPDRSRQRARRTSYGPRGASRPGAGEVPLQEADPPRLEKEADRHPIGAEREVDTMEVGVPPFGAAPSSSPGGRSTVGERSRGWSAGGADDPHAEPIHRPGKEPVGGQGAEPAPGAWPSPYHVVGTEDWLRAVKLLIGRVSPSDRYEGEPGAEHRFEPDGRMDVRSSVLRSVYSQVKAVEEGEDEEEEDDDEGGDDGDDKDGGDAGKGN